MQYLENPEPDEDLINWLSGLDEPRLAQVLTNRPDALAAPWPRRLADLARRLSTRDSVAPATRELTAPGLQILCAVQLCGALGEVNGVPLAKVAAWLGSSAVDVGLAMGPLTARGLAWLDANNLIQVPATMKGHSYVQHGLGDPLAPPLSRLNIHQLDEIARRLGVSSDSRRQVLLDDLMEFFRNGARVRDLVADAPPGVAELLSEFVADGPDRKLDLNYVRAYRNAPVTETPSSWAAARCLLVGGYDGNAQMPLEIGLALRGEDFRLPFTPQPPAMRIAPVSPERVSAETAAAALRLLDRVTTVVESAPFPLLKTGGIGKSLIKKLTKDTGATTEEILLVLELALEAELLLAEEPPPPAPRSRKPVPPPMIVPTAEFTRWRGESSAAQLRELLDAWWRLPGTVLDDEPSNVGDEVRHLTVRMLAELEPGTGVIDDETLGDLSVWHAPTVDEDTLRVLVTSSLAEATLVGVAASNAVGDLGHALVSGDVDALRKATEELVAGAVATALFGTDLTAIVTGPPSTELATLLDRVADRETQGSASTWRFSPATVRRALDNGETPEGLIDELGSVARGELPQPLTYLINDISRRHGEVGVIDVRSVIVGDNPGLLAEIAAHRKLLKLGVALVAPSVLTSSADAVTTLAALRDAGYAPVQRGSDGAVVVRAEKPVVAAVEPLAIAARPGVVEDPIEHAARLLRESDSAPRPLKRGALMNLMPGNRSGNWMRLIWQLETGFPVWVTYEEDDGTKRKLLVSSPELHGETLDVWCDEPGGYRRLELSRISPGGD
ncbi:helicase-associated domain-containing protein [Amycolatopsis sp.]|jgi:hypothetical protein|uniref:helicase-associated domain-containing protein n=1 Tax=Amycolatopsis sp. TaxID=37632 RepID=UPI002DF9725A|nr:helicase-associated domain-containing protein [Amycolatopsis sp.]